MEIMNNELLIGICSRYPVSRVQEKREKKMRFTIANTKKNTTNKMGASDLRIMEATL